MTSAAGRDGETFRGGALIPVLFFITPLFTAAAPRLAPFFLPIVATVLIIVALRRGLPWRELLQPNAAMAALIAVALYAGLSAIWAEDPDGALSKASLLIAATLVVFAASAVIPTLDKTQVRRASLAFVAGALCAAGFVMTELLTDGALTRFAMNTIPAFRPDRAKHVAIRHGLVTKINVSEFNQHVAMLALQFWPGLLALRVLAPPRRNLLTVLFFLALVLPIAISEHDSSQVGLIASLILFPLTLVRPPRRHPRAGNCLVPRLRSRHPSRLPRLQGCAAPGGLAAEIGPRQDHHLGIHGRARAREPRARHRRRLDPGGEGESRDRAGETGRLRVPPHHRAART